MYRNGAFMDKTDRRIQRTRKLINNALLDLLMDKKFSEITIQEITDTANVGRATFYLHYHNKDDCLMQLLTEGFDSLVAEIKKNNEEQNDFVGSIEHTFAYISKNRKLYLALLGDRIGEHILMGVRNYIKADMMQIITVPADFSPELHEAMATYLAGAQLALLLWWLKEEPNITTREAAALYVDISLNGITHYIESGVHLTE